MISQISDLIEHSQDIKHSNEIFVVDDDRCVRNLLTAILPLEGFPVTCFENGEAFLQRASERVPVCVFLDVIMPGRSGLDVLKELNTRNYKPPVFLISARGEVQMVDEALKNGARGFLRKPFDPYAAVERVREAVEFWNGRHEKKDTLELDTTGFRSQLRLTPRESEVLAHITRGLSSQDIADTLGLGKRTIDDLRIKAMKKLGAKNSADLIRLVMNIA
jgi:two-component system response regulator FixJ